MITFGGFGGGIQTGNTCGAILAAVSVLSMLYIEKTAHESACDILEQVINEYKKK